MPVRSDITFKILKEIEEEIVELERKLNEARAYRQKLIKIKKEPRTGIARGGGDKLVVSRLELRNEILNWYARYQQEHGVANGAWSVLSARSNVPARTIRYIRDMKNDKKWITLALAEDLLIAMDKQDELQPGGKIQIVPNPRFTPNHYCEE